MNTHRTTLLTLKGASGVAVVVFVFAWTLTTHGKFSVSGDEPHYLMISESIRSDRDLDLSNNYAQDDGRLFGHRNLPMELHALPARNGETRSIHALGMAVFVLPVYVVAQELVKLIPEEQLRRFQMNAGLFAYSIVSVSLIALTALGVSIFATGLSNIAGAARSRIIAIAIGISPPVVSHSFLIFPEVFALFVSCLVGFVVTKKPGHHDRRWLLWIVLAVGVLPWFHQKYLVYSLGLAFVIGWRRRDLLTALRVRGTVAALFLFLAPQVLLLMWLRYEWGSIGGALTIGALTRQNVPLTADAFVPGAIGLLFDRQSGLAAFTPLCWLVPSFFALAWKRSWDLLVPIALLYVPAAAFVIGWWAGFSPAARYLVPMIPLLAIPAAHAIGYRSVRVVGSFLLVFQLVIDATVWQNPRWLWPAASGNRVLDALSVPGRVYELMLVNVRSDGMNAHAVVPLVIAVLLTAVIVAFARIERHRNARTAGTIQGA